MNRPQLISQASLACVFPQQINRIWYNTQTLPRSDKPLQNRSHRPGIAAAEMIEVVDEMIKVVDFAASVIAGGERPGFAIGLVETRRKAAEEFRHRQVGLAVSVVRGWIDEGGLAGGRRQVVATPEVAVEDGGRGLRRQKIVEPAVEDFQGTIPGGLPAPAIPRHLHLGFQSMMAEEGRPTRRPHVDLRQASDEVVLIKPKLLGGVAVHRGQSASERLPEPLAFGSRVDPFHQQKAGTLAGFTFSGHDGGDEKRAVGVAERAQAGGFGRERPGHLSPAVFQEKRPVVGVKARGVGDASSPHGRLPADGARQMGSYSLGNVGGQRHILWGVAG